MLLRWLVQVYIGRMCKQQVNRFSLHCARVVDRWTRSVARHRRDIASSRCICMCFALFVFGISASSHLSMHIARSFTLPCLYSDRQSKYRMFVGDRSRPCSATSKMWPVHTIVYLHLYICLSTTISHPPHPLSHHLSFSFFHSNSFVYRDPMYSLAYSTNYILSFTSSHPHSLVSVC